MATFSTQFDPDHRNLSEARAELSAWLAETCADVGRDAAMDIEVVVTELAANVIDHTESTWVRVRVTVAGEHAVVEVRNDAAPQAVPDVARWGEPVAGARGRGLRIVRGLCCDIDVGGEPATTGIRCRIEVS